MSKTLPCIKGDLVRYSVDADGEIIAQPEEIPDRINSPKRGLKALWIFILSHGLRRSLTLGRGGEFELHTRPDFIKYNGLGKTSVRLWVITLPDGSAGLGWHVLPAGEVSGLKICQIVPPPDSPVAAWIGTPIECRKGLEPGSQLSAQTEDGRARIYLRITKGIKPVLDLDLYLHQS